MRARSIKPGICDNEVLGTADPFYTLLFERLWMMADREGRLEDRPLRIKAQAFPYRDELDVEPMLEWLREHDFVLRYAHGNDKYIQILKFRKHQSPHVKEAASTIPAPDEPGASMVQEQGCDPPFPAPAALTPSSLTPDCGLWGRHRNVSEPLPEGLDLPSWERWLVYRTEIRRPLKPASIPAAQRKLAAYGVDQAAVVEQSIANGYQGLFALKDKPRAEQREVDKITWRPPPEEDEQTNEARHARG